MTLFSVDILGNIYHHDPRAEIFQETGHEPAGSEGAKFRLWVKSKGLSLEPGERTVKEGEGEGEEEEEEDTEDTRLFLPTGTEQVRIFYLLPGSLLYMYLVFVVFVVVTLIRVRSGSVNYMVLLLPTQLPASLSVTSGIIKMLSHQGWKAGSPPVVPAIFLWVHYLASPRSSLDHCNN